jgi:hypothetical protein
MNKREAKESIKEALKHIERSDIRHVARKTALSAYQTRRATNEQSSIKS